MPIDRIADILKLARRHKTGYGSYGMCMRRSRSALCCESALGRHHRHTHTMKPVAGPPQGWQRGTRVLRYNFGIHGGADMQTWIRQEDGTVLNDTLAGTMLEQQTICNAGLRPSRMGH